MSIFNCSSSARPGPTRPPSKEAPQLAPSSSPNRGLGTTFDARLIEILDLPKRSDETLDLAFKRKERELGEAFAHLTVREALELHRRLCNPRPGDEVAHRFGRLIVERRVRLLNFLVDARRRAALATARKDRP